MPDGRASRVLVTAALVCLVAACSNAKPRPAASEVRATTTVATAVTTSPTVPPPTQPTTSTTQAAPATTAAGAGPFVGEVSAVTAADVPYSYRAGCPVGPDQLRSVHLSYWGFDNQAHVGTMVVNAAVTQDVLKIFGVLYRERFPIHQMQPIDVYHASDPASMDADNTSGFNCRNAVTSGPPQWSVHAYGEAIDVNTVENPYVLNGTVQPSAGSAYVDRSVYRPGMAVPGGQLVQAFASAGWLWGGRWSSPDYQHFSKTGG
jgi:hypothetical protein